MAQEPMDVYIATLIKEAGLGSLPAEQQASFVDKLKIQIDRRLGLIALQELNEAGLAEFEKLMKVKPTPKPEQVQEFFAAKIPDFGAKVEAGLKTFAEEFVGAAKKG